MLAIPSPSRWTVQLDSNSISGMNPSSAHVNEFSSSSKLGLPSRALKVFLKDVRWQGRASGMQGGVLRAKHLAMGRLANGSTFNGRRKLLAFHVGVGEGSSTSRASTHGTWTSYERQRWRDTRIRAAEDDFEVEDAVDYEMDGAGEDDEDEGDLRDYETEYDMPMGDYTVQESETFMSTEGVEEERVVDYKIDEDEFHKLSLYECDFFIRKIQDQDDDVFDFREMYVTAPDTDTYAIPKVIGEMPKKPLRCMKSNYEYISVTEPPVDTPRAPLSKTEYQAMKVFLMKHYRNLREDHEDFALDFENIYVIDSTTKSITKADVKVEVRRGKYRDRSAETLIVRDDGTTFKVIPSEEVHSPDDVIQALQWDRTKENMDNYLRGFRDYEKSKWF